MNYDKLCFGTITLFSDCALLGPGGCRGQGWDNGEWPILVKGPRSLSDCCKECTKKKGCSGFHIGKLKDEKGDCFLFSHTAITPVKSLGGECYQLKKGKNLRQLLKSRKNNLFASFIPIYR